MVSTRYRAVGEPTRRIDEILEHVDELFDDNPRGHKMNECEKGLAQFLIPRGNASKLFEVIKEPCDLLPQLHYPTTVLNYYEMVR